MSPYFFVWSDAEGPSGHTAELWGPYVSVPYAAPEPATALLLGSGLAGAAGLVWRRKR